jgi:hypothetical protein
MHLSDDGIIARMFWLCERLLIDTEPADVDSAFDVAPFFALAESSYELLKGCAIGRRVFRPSDKVKGFAQFIAMRETASDGGEILQAATVSLLAQWLS